MSNIPFARQALQDLAADLHSDGKTAEAQAIRDIIKQYLIRERPVRKGRAKSASVTEEMAENIRQFARAKPNLHLNEIGRHFGVNQGRVSECLRGLR